MKQRTSLRPVDQYNFSPAEVRQIREMYASGNYSQTDLARQFRSSPTAIHNVVKNITHKGI